MQIRTPDYDVTRAAAVLDRAMRPRFPELWKKQELFRSVRAASWVGFLRAAGDLLMLYGFEVVNPLDAKLTMLYVSLDGRQIMIQPSLDDGVVARWDGTGDDFELIPAGSLRFVPHRAAIECLDGDPLVVLVSAVMTRFELRAK